MNQHALGVIEFPEVLALVAGRAIPLVDPIDRMDVATGIPTRVIVDREPAAGVLVPTPSLSVQIESGDPSSGERREH